MEQIPKTERHTDRDEKVSAGKLHATQYIVVLVLAVLAAGMWRLQVLGVDNYRMLAEANRVRKEPVLSLIHIWFFSNSWCNGPDFGKAVDAGG